MKNQTKKKQIQKTNKKMKMMHMLPKQKKIKPIGVILGLIYLDMLHHVQPQHDSKIIKRQREILKPFMRRAKNKTTKIKRGGHAFYYNVLPEVCELGAHNTDCQPSTLYYLGILTREEATHLAEIIGEGQGHLSSTMLEWFDEMFPDDAPHIEKVVVNLGDYYLTDKGLNEMNAYVMGLLNHILPYNNMGVMAVINYHAKYDTETLYAGELSESHSICFIRDQFGQLVLVDSQNGYFNIIYDIHSLLHALGNAGTDYPGELSVFIQESVVDKFDIGNYTHDPNNYSLPHNLNTERLFELTRRNFYKEGSKSNNEYEEELIDNSNTWAQRQMAQAQQNNAEDSSSGEEEVIDESNMLGERQMSQLNGTQYKNAQWDDWYQRWYNSTGYYNEDGTYHYYL